MIIQLEAQVNEPQWAEIINKVQDRYLPKLLKEKKHPYIEDFIYKTVKESGRESFIAHYKINGRDKYIACFGKTGCATCGNGGYVSDWRMFENLQQIYGFISDAELKKLNVITEEKMNNLFNLKPKAVELDENREKALLIFSSALIVVLLKDYSLLEFNLDFNFKYFFDLHEDKLAHFCSVLKPFEKNQTVIELMEKAQKILQEKKREREKLILQSSYTDELIVWVNNNLQEIEENTKIFLAELQKKVAAENPRLYPNKQAEIFASKYIKCFLKAVDTVWNKQKSDPIIWENTLCLSYFDKWYSIKSSLFILRFSNKQKLNLYQTKWV